MKLRALAKINLGLDVVRKREDGYHEVRMIMQNLNLCDELEMEKTEAPGITLTTNLRFLPVDQNNLVYRAAEMLMQEFQVKEGLRIHLQKRIPVAAGMAGGSSDAASAMVGVNKLFQLGLSTEELMERAVKIGADVPYCVMRGTAMSEGIGEVLTPLPPMPPCTILIGKPGISVSTKWVYTNLKANEIRNHPDIDGMVQAVKEGSLKGIVDRLGNVLEDVTIPAHPVIREIKQLMVDHGALGALMSGSGPTVFGIFDDAKKAKLAKAKLSESGLARQIYLTRPFRIGGNKHE